MRWRVVWSATARFDGIETARVMARLYAAARLHVNLSPTVLQAQGEASRGRKGHQALSRTSDAVRASASSPTAVQGHQAAAAQTYCSLDPVALLARSARHRTNSASGSASADLQPRLPDSRPIRLRLRDRRHHRQDRRGARHSSPAKTTLQETDTHALQARSVSGDDRELACDGAADHGARHRAPARRDRSSHV